MGFVREGVTSPVDPNGRDRFGLPQNWSLLGETEADRKSRITSAEALIKDAFETAVRHFGYEDARRRFNEVVKKPPPGKQANKEIIDELLIHYDRETRGGALGKAEAPGRIGEALYETYGIRFGASADAIEKKLRRALKAREKAEAERAERILMYQAQVAANVKARGTNRG
jgi:hypothetical protein